MPLAMYQVTVPVFLRGFEVLSTLLRKGEAHAQTTGMDPADLVGARLAPDMLSLAGQVQRASDTAKFTACRLTGREARTFADIEASFAELEARIAKTSDFLWSFAPGEFDESEHRPVMIGTGDRRRSFIGQDYVFSFALPNFFFHVTTAYDILRYRGVSLSKSDYIGTAGK